MKNHFSALLILLAACSLSLQSQVKLRTYIEDDNWPSREHNVDFQHMRLEVEFVPAKGLVKGKVTHLFSPLQVKVDSVWLDGIDMNYKKVSVNGKPADFQKSDKGITIYFKPALTWQTKDSLTVEYEVNPRRGLYFIGWNDPKNLSRKQIWSQGQGIDNRCWIPMYDEMNDKMTTEMYVKFESGYEVLSNGTKLPVKDNKDGTKTWHYKMKNPHSPYLVMLGIGKYAIKQTKSKSGVPMNLFYYPEYPERVEPTYRYSEQMMDWLENETGFKYGWESYSQIPLQDYMFGAMENTTATVFGDFLLVDERSFLDRPYVGVNAHELAHQWFGDLITARSARHHWLQESFATYYNQMFEREVFGMDYFDWARRNATNSALDESKKNKLPIAHSDAGSVRHYPKGAFVLNMLKYVVGGREAYNKAIKYYLEKHKYGNVDSHDLMVAFEETLGYSLDWYWDQWVYKGGEPAYQVSYRTLNNSVEFSVSQTQEMNELSGLFKMPIWFEVHFADGTSEKKQVWIQDKSHVVNLPNPSNKEVAYVLFDPNSEILKSFSFAKPFEMLSAQALKAKYMIDRFDAVFAMRNISIEKKKAVLIKVFYAEKFHSIKGEILFQLNGNTDPDVVQLIKDAIADKDVNVRKAVVQNIRQLPNTLIGDMEMLLLDPSYELVASTLDYLTTLLPENTSKYLETTKSTVGTVGRNVRVKWLEIACSKGNDKSAVMELMNYCSNSYEFRTRVNAMNALKKLGLMNKELLPAFFDAILSSNGRLSGPAIDVLKYFYEQNDYKAVISNYIQTSSWEPWQRERIKSYFF
jgi:aminopeptidase N